MREPGVETDRHGYDLRYVHISADHDFAEYAVLSDHTSVYDGHGAPERYLTTLRDHDYGEKRCGPPPTYDGDGGGGDIDWPTPGDQGLPDGLLTGGNCAGKWWC
ncbi:hypothetical protein BJF78_28255 [Pseudonocardia sp. CNS-139]|nr:hypothetical protein BJF78_28255 [Pseudonocardia sp. CNS-139]